MDKQLYTRWRDAQDLLRFQSEELLPLSLEYAKEIGAGKIIIFSFQREGEPPDRIPDEVLEVLRQAAELTGKEGLELAIEVEQGYWADTGASTAELVKTVNRPSLGVNWDPANAFEAGDIPFPDGYGAVRQFVRHVHFKDIRRSPQGRPVYAVEGQIDWSGQIKALAQDGYQGYISVETHLQPKVSSARRMTSRLQELMSAAKLQTREK
jgi:sugar phosphate isomerase/epimerase